MDLEVHPVRPSFAARITGVDLASLSPNATAALDRKSVV